MSATQSSEIQSSETQRLTRELTQRIERLVDTVSSHYNFDKERLYRELELICRRQVRAIRSYHKSIEEDLFKGYGVEQAE
jgi:hypothetical protein